jgi:hypothetical protein
MTRLLPLLLICLLSCTLEKRHYRPGYYIDWHRPGERVADDQRDKHGLHDDAAVREPECSHAKDTTVVKDWATAAVPATESITANASEAPPVGRDTGPGKPAKIETAAEPLPYHPYARPSLLAGLGAYGLSVMAIVLASASGNTENGSDAAGAVSIVSLLAVVSAILAIVWGSRVMRDTRRNPHTYSGRQQARVGLWLGIVFIALSLLTAVLLVLIVAWLARLGG